MFQRGIGDDELRKALTTGKTIAEYPEDKPYPSKLILGWRGTSPLHIVIADNAEEEETIVITVHEPDEEQWESNFEKRRQQ